jgi:hypothetical protein
VLAPPLAQAGEAGLRPQRAGDEIEQRRLAGAAANRPDPNAAIF